MRNKILIVEDEPGIAESLKYLLDSEGFETLWVETLEDARKQMGMSSEGGVSNCLFEPHLVVLDIGLPDGNGTEFCKEIRNSNWENLPVLFLTARQEEIDKIIALEIGGDDYVTKPFSGREVSARIKAILRRSTFKPKLSHLAESVASVTSVESAQMSETMGSKHSDLANSVGSSESDLSLAKPIVEVDLMGEKGPVYINEIAACVEVNGSKVELSRNEYHLLKLLLENPGQVFSRGQIMQAVWEVPEMSMERTVDSHVKSLRKKLLPISCIQTQRGFGYKFELEEN